MGPGRTSTTFNKLVLDACNGLLQEHVSQIVQVLPQKKYDREHSRIEHVQSTDELIV